MINQNDIDFIEKNKDKKATKQIAKTLQKIKDNELGVERRLRVRRCFCAQSERDSYKDEFYLWYENYKPNE
jgi:hypothetical protein